MVDENQFNALDQRITRVEAHYESLSGTLTEGFGEIKQMIRSNQVSVRQEMDSLLHRIDAKTKPQTNIVLQIIGIGITIAVISGGLVASRMNAMETQYRRDADKISERHKWLESEVIHHHEDGHPHVVIQRVESNLALIGKLEAEIKEIKSRRWSENDQAQDERMRALERAVYGKSTKED